MKHMKQKLIAMTAMMVLSAIMLSSVSYAWFTLSTNPEITDMKVNVVANQNLEIALDNGYADEAAVNSASEFATGVQGSTSGNPYTWGNLVDLTTAFGSFVPRLQPVKFTNTSGAVSFDYPKYGDDGRVKELGDLVETIFSDHTDVSGDKLLGGVKGYSVTTEIAPYYAFSVDFWVRTNVAGDLALQTAAGVDRAEDNDPATDSSIKVNNTPGAGSNITVPGYNDMGAEKQTALNAYMGNLKIVFVLADGTEANATLEHKGAGKYDLKCNKITTLVRNEAQKISMYVYLDGEAITNEMALLADVNNVIFNIQFKNTNIKDAQAMTGDDYVEPDTP